MSCARLFAFLCVVSSFVPAQASERYYSVDDMLALEQIGEVRYTLDGSFILFEKTRAYEAMDNFAAGSMLDKNNTDIFIAPARGDRSPKPLLSLNGAPNWMGALSPTGEHMVVFWYEAGRIKTGVYTFASKRLAEAEGMIASAYESLDRSPVWVSNTAIVFQSVSLEHQRTLAAASIQNSVERRRLEEATWSGDAPGVTHFKTKGKDPVDDIDDGALIHFDVKRRKSTILAKGDHRGIFPSIEGGAFAVVEYRGKRLIENEMEVVFEPFKYDNLVLHLFDNDALDKPATLCANTCGVRSGIYLKWSDSGRKLAFVAHDNDPAYEKLTLYVHDTQTGERKAVTAPALVSEPSVYGQLYSQIPNGVWLGEQMVSRVKRPASEAETPAGDRDKPAKPHSYDWYAVSDDGAAAQNLTAHLSEVPEDYIGVWDQKLLLSIDGDIVALSADGETRVLTEANKQQTAKPWCVFYATWRDGFRRFECGEFQRRGVGRGLDPLLMANDKLVIQTVAMKDGAAHSSDEEKRFAVLDLKTGAMTALASLPATDLLLAVSPNGLSAVSKRSGRTGGALKVIKQGNERDLVLFNTHLKEVKASIPIYMPHEREDGATAHDWLLLPPNHKEGERHPLIVKFYPGNVRRGDQWSGDGDIGRGVSVMNEHVLAAAGYAVLVAGMPALDHADNQTSAPMREMHEPLIAAATRAVEAGYADPDRWFLMGYSYGGYGTLSALTQTDKFRGGVAFAGPYNLTSYYGLFNRGATAIVKTFFMPSAVGWAETNQGRMGAAPWEKPERYISNSPVFHLDDVQGAVLLIHGDLDAVDVGDAEQVFTAMSRLGKDAEFIRLWGEGHLISSPSSIRYSYDSIFKWLNRLDD